MVTENVPQQPEKRSTRIMGKPDDHIVMASDDGAINAGNMSEWLQARRKMQEFEKDKASWIRKMKALEDFCRFWLPKAGWASEIAIKLNEEPDSVTLYIVPQKYECLTLSQRREAALLGLGMGNLFDVRAESRITASRPVECTNIISLASVKVENANEQPACEAR